MSDQDATPLDLVLWANQVAIVDILTRAGCLESREVDSVEQTLQVQNDLAEQEWAVSDEKLSLAFDKPIQQGMEVGQFIYPSTIRNPKDYIYRISDPVDSLKTSISIRRSPTRADMVEYPLSPESSDYTDSLFDIHRFSVDYQSLDILPMQQTTSAGVLRMKRDWTGS